MTNYKFFNKDNKHKYLWGILGIITIGMLTSATQRVNNVCDNAELGKKAYHYNIKQDSIINSNTKRIDVVERTSLIIMEKLTNIEKRLDELKEDIKYTRHYGYNNSKGN